MRYRLNNDNYAMVDEEDRELLDRHKWYVTSRGYAATTIYRGKKDGRYVNQTMSMHRLILGAPKGKDVDHKNGNRLDNRRQNLRLATRSQNVANSGRRSNRKQDLPRGINYNPSIRSKQPYMARITKEGKTYFLGNFYKLNDAVKAYHSKRRELFGEFAR